MLLLLLLPLLLVLPPMTKSMSSSSSSSSPIHTERPSSPGTATCIRPRVEADGGIGGGNGSGAAPSAAVRARRRKRRRGPMSQRESSTQGRDRKMAPPPGDAQSSGGTPSASRERSSGSSRCSGGGGRKSTRTVGCTSRFGNWSRDVTGFSSIVFGIRCTTCQPGPMPSRPAGWLAGTCVTTTFLQTPEVLLDDPQAAPSATLLSKPSLLAAAAAEEVSMGSEPPSAADTSAPSAASSQEIGTSISSSRTPASMCALMTLLDCLQQKVIVAGTRSLRKASMICAGCFTGSSFSRVMLSMIMAACTLWARARPSSFTSRMTMNTCSWTNACAHEIPKGRSWNVAVMRSNTVVRSSSQSPERDGHSAVATPKTPGVGAPTTTCSAGECWRPAHWPPPCAGADAPRTSVCRGRSA
mmetsp:Transcript_18687/g.65267  ORF Transcript_18687/g.65267 Transcript_18687/m.65267 type:complete len:412 (-) Transcript_18687:473-1708(-)